MAVFAVQPIDPFRILMDADAGILQPEGPTLVRRLSDLEGLFRNRQAWQRDLSTDDRIIYQVSSSPVPEAAREVPQSITMIMPGACAEEFYMTKGHQHPDPQGEIYLGLSGHGGLLLHNGERTKWVEMSEGVIGYIPPGWAHRSVNTGAEPYKFLAVYPGSAGHDYDWVVKHGMGKRVMRGAEGPRLVDWED